MLASQLRDLQVCSPAVFVVSLLMHSSLPFGCGVLFWVRSLLRDGIEDHSASKTLQDLQVWHVGSFSLSADCSFCGVLLSAQQAGYAEGGVEDQSPGRKLQVAVRMHLEQGRILCKACRKRRDMSCSHSCSSW